MSYACTKAWVWFKDGLDKGGWRCGCHTTDNVEHKGAMKLQFGGFKDCVVSAWRISDKNPSDFKKGPAHAGQS